MYFNVDDLIVYGSNGVCKVLRISKLDIGQAEDNKLYYTLEPVYQRGTVIYTPIDNEKVVMRPVMTKEEAYELIDQLDEIDLLEAENEKALEHLYKVCIGKYNGIECFKVIKTLYMKRMERIQGGKKVTATDSRYLHIAEESLFGELSIALEMPKEKICALIGNRFKQIIEQ